MGFWDRIRGISSYDPAQVVLPEPYEAFVSTGGIPVMDPGSPLHYWTHADVEKFWRTQPNLRKVVGFVARSVASTPLHAYDRVSDIERQRLTDHPLAQLLRSPRPHIGPYRFWESVLSDGLLYDRWAVLKEYQDDGSLHLTHIPSWRLQLFTDALQRVTGASYWVGDSTSRGDSREDWIPLDLDALIFDFGYAPRTAGLSPVETLKDILDETAEAIAYRRDVWENGARVPGYVSRPKDAGTWTPEQRSKFVAHMRSVYGRDGSNAGGLPILEDGMALASTDVYKPQDTLDLEGRQLTAVEVAASYHIAPELVGARQGNYSNMDAFRQMMYGPSLGPYITAWEQAINVGLTPELSEGRAIYVEANVDAKLRGSFLEQAEVMQRAVGGPYLLRNEVRSMQNRSPLPGGDELIVPLNVLVGGQASPTDSGSQNRSAGPERAVKSRAPQTHETKHEQVLSAFFKRQERVVRGALGVKADGDWWDAERWDGELADDLYRLSTMTSEHAAREALEALGIDADDFDLERTLAYLLTVAKGDAERINETTREQIADALDAEDRDDALAKVFEENRTSRAAQMAATLVAFAAGFGTVEAAKQQAPTSTKTWVVNSANPRPSHARMSGETVPVGEKFSNGMSWPGAFGRADQVAGCKCSVTVSIPQPEEGD